MSGIGHRSPFQYLLWNKGGEKALSACSGTEVRWIQGSWGANQGGQTSPQGAGFLEGNPGAS